MSEKKYTPDENLKKLGKQVRQLRKGRKWSQQKLSDVSGLAVRTISRIERGVMNPSFEVLAALVDVLGIIANFLYPMVSPLIALRNMRFIAFFFDSF